MSGVDARLAIWRERELMLNRVASLEVERDAYRQALEKIAEALREGESKRCRPDTALALARAVLDADGKTDGAE